MWSESFESLMVSFAMSLIFFNHTNATNSIKLTRSLRLVLLGKRPASEGRGEPGLSL